MSLRKLFVPGTRRGIRWWLRTTDQTTVAALTLLSIAAIGATVVSRGALSGRAIYLDEAEPRPLSWQVDVNAADWPELTVLPDLGDQLARRIVDDRRRRGPFRSAADLRRVPGIGPKTVARIRPYLAPFPTSAEPPRRPNRPRDSADSSVP